jgi:TetR/AcrR family transcriptional repressor of lmrAB and yxaGH operons
VVPLGEKSNPKEAIVTTAARLFFSQGYHATGLNQIVKESCAPKGSLYHYFPNGKEELAHVCIGKANEHIVHKFRDTFAAYDNTGDAIRHFIHETADEAEAAGFTGFLPFSFWAAVETSCISDKLRKASQEVFDAWQEIIAERLRLDGFEEKKAHEMALLILSMMEGALIISLTHQSKEPMLNAADYLSVLTKNADLLN